MLKQFIVSSLIILCLINCNTALSKETQPSFLSYYKEGVKFHNEGALDKAIFYLNNALNLNPNDLPTLIELGVVFYEQSNYKSAIQALEHAVSLSSNDSLSHILLANSYKKNNEYKKSIEHYKLASELETGNLLLKLNLGSICLKAEDYNCATQNLGKVILAYPNHIKAKTLLGETYQSLKEYGLAKEQYKNVLKYFPHNKTIWHNLAKTHISLGENKDARSCLDKAISLDSTNVDFYLDRAFVNYTLNKLEEAENDYLTALKLDNVNPSPTIEYANFLWETGAYKKASEQFSKAIELEPDNYELLANKAFLLQLANIDNEAIVSWQEVLGRDKNNETALFNLAKLYQKSEKFDKSISLYRQLISLKEKASQQDLEASLELAYCLQKSNDLNEAKTIYESILSQDPLNVTSNYNLGILYSKEKNSELAIKHLEKSLASNFQPREKVYENLINEYKKTNNTEKVKDTYKGWLNIEKNNIEVRTNYANYLSSLGDIQGAIDQFRGAVVLDSTNKTRYTLAGFLVKTKDYFGAVGQLQEYLKTYTQDLNALILLANAFKELGIKEEAVKTYKKIISFQYDNYLAYYNLGILNQQKDDNEEAKNYLLKCIELNENYAPAHFALGLTYMKANEKEKAKALFEKYLRLEPDGEYKQTVELKLKELISSQAVTYKNIPETN